jgi:hypothetical protein
MDQENCVLITQAKYNRICKYAIRISLKNLLRRTKKFYAATFQFLAPEHQRYSDATVFPSFSFAQLSANSNCCFMLILVLSSSIASGALRSGLTSR